MFRQRPRSLGRRRYSLARLVRANAFDLFQLIRESRYGLGGFALVMLVGMVYIHFAFGLSYAESLYETFRMLTLQSGLAFPRDPGGMALFFLVPLLGLALILDSVFRFGRRLLDKGSRQEGWQVSLASTYQGHVVVCGIGRVGLRVVTHLLAAGHKVVVVEQRWESAFVPRALELKVPVVAGDARSLAVLRQAGVQRASAVVLCIDGDLVNIEVALKVRSLRPGLRVILRVFSDDLDQNLEEVFGRNSVFSASALAAPTFAAAAVSRDVRAVLGLDARALGVVELTIAPESLMSGFARKVEEEYGIRVIEHRNARGKLLPPVAMRQLESGDHVLLLGPLAALDALRQKNVPRSKAHAILGSLPPHGPTRQHHRVIVCGLGKVGYRVVRQLHQQPDPPSIVCIYSERTRQEFVHSLAELDGVTLIEGDARSAALLQDAGLGEAYSVVAVTSDDFVNLQICLSARRARKDVHLVMRLFSDVLVEQFESLFGMRTVYSASALAAPTLAAAGMLGDVRAAFYCGDALFATDEFALAEGDPLLGSSIRQLRESRDIVAITLCRGGEVATLPAHDLALAAGDALMVLGTLDALAALRAYRAAPPAAARR